MLSLVEGFEAEGALPHAELLILDTLAEKGAMTTEQLERLVGRRLTRPLLHLIELGAVHTEGGAPRHAIVRSSLAIFALLPNIKKMRELYPLSSMDSLVRHGKLSY